MIAFEIVLVTRLNRDTWQSTEYASVDLVFTLIANTFAHYSVVSANQ